MSCDWGLRCLSFIGLNMYNISVGTKIPHFCIAAQILCLMPLSHMTLSNLNIQTVSGNPGCQKSLGVFLEDEGKTDMSSMLCRVLMSECDRCTDRHRQTDRQTDAQTDTDRQTDNGVLCS